MISRRRMLQLAGAGCVASGASPRAMAAGYPDRPVKLVVPVPAGGALDIIGRLMAQWLSEKLGQSFIVENKPGAATNIGVEFVARATPDGYTLLLVPGSVAVNPALYDNLNYDFKRDFTPIALISRLPLVFEVNNDVPVKTVAEFVAWAKANKGKVNLATAGVGSTQHIAGELLKLETGIEMAPVPFAGGGPALVALMGGQVQAMFSPLPESIGAIKAGQARAIAVTTSERLAALPDTPTVAETIPGFEAATFQGIGAPAGVPREVIEKVNAQVNLALADPAIKKRLAELGSIPSPGTPERFASYVASETEKWGKVIRAAHIKAG